MAILDFLAILAMYTILILFVVFLLKVIGHIQNRFPLEHRVEKLLWKISIIFVLISPFIIPVKVANLEQFEVITFGFPIGFIHQYSQLSLLDRNFPFSITLINHYKHSLLGGLNFRIDLFIYSVLFTYLIIRIFSYISIKRGLIKVRV